MRPAVFLDRDGTMIEAVPYLAALDAVALFPWTVDAVLLLNEAQYRVVVVTNQSGVARGFFDEAFVVKTHHVLDLKLRAGGARIDRYYYCPHYHDGKVEKYRRACGCRKPEPGMLHQAARELDIDLARSFVVGDRWLDVQLAQAVGARGILVRTGDGANEAASPVDGVIAAAVKDDLLAAAEWILEETAPMKR